jgi:hypothetical protein
MCRIFRVGNANILILQRLATLLRGAACLSKLLFRHMFFWGWVNLFRAGIPFLSIFMARNDESHEVNLTSALGGETRFPN